MQSYQINQFLVESELPLPADPSFRPYPDASLERLQVQRTVTRWSEPGETSLRSSVYDGQFRSYRVPGGLLICVEDTVQLLVPEQGDTLRAYAQPGSEQEAAVHVVGMGMILMAALRGHLCLHAACVDVAGKRIGLLAQSGTGKSSTAWALMQEGAQFVSDDLLLVRVRDGVAQVTPSVSLFPKVDPRMLHWSGMDRSRCRQVLPNGDKLWYSLPTDQRSAALAPLAHLFLLQPLPPQEARLADSSGSGPDPIQVRPVRGLGALGHLLAHSQAVELAAELRGETPDLVPKFAALLGVTPVSALSYPKRLDLLPALTQAIRGTITARGSLQ